MMEKDLLLNNKLIAEFMEINIYYLGNGCLFKNPETLLPCTEKELEYHTSWDWLIPVCKKCRDLIGNVYIGNNTTQFHYYDLLFRGVRSYDIEVTYNGVVEFIKYLNNNPLK